MLGRVSRTENWWRETAKASASRVGQATDYEKQCGVDLCEDL